MQKRKKEEEKYVQKTKKENEKRKERNRGKEKKYRTQKGIQNGKGGEMLKV